MSALASTFSITCKRQIWRVTLDGAFYGDYRTRRHATESADAAAEGLRKQGRAVTVLAPQTATASRATAPLTDLS